MKPAPPVTTKISVIRRLYHPYMWIPAAPRAEDDEMDAPCSRRARARRASARERGGAESASCLPVLLARRREDVEHHAADIERPPAVRHVRRRLPEVAFLHVVLDAVLDADPLALETHAPLLV